MHSNYLFGWATTRRGVYFVARLGAFSLARRLGRVDAALGRGRLLRNEEALDEVLERSERVRSVVL